MTKIQDAIQKMFHHSNETTAQEGQDQAAQIEQEIIATLKEHVTVSYEARFVNFALGENREIEFRIQLASLPGFPEDYIYLHSTDLTQEAEQTLPSTDLPVPLSSFHETGKPQPVPGGCGETDFVGTAYEGEPTDAQNAEATEAPTTESDSPTVDAAPTQPDSSTVSAPDLGI